MTRTIVLKNGKVRGLHGWHIYTTDGRSISDRLNTADPIAAKAHVDYLLGKGYQFKSYTYDRWYMLQECAADWATHQEN